MSQVSVGGATYFVLFKDDATSFRVIECIRTKSEQEVLGCLKQYVGQLRRETGQGLKMLRSSSGSEYLGKEITSYLEQFDVKHELTTSYTPEQNGASREKFAPSLRPLVACSMPVTFTSSFEERQ